MSLNAWMLGGLWTTIKKEGNGVQEPLYKELKTRGILSRPNIEEKSRPLD